ncbi:MAG: anthranilate synthase component I [Deltaproteobacteria bacterium]|nr:anthranilate synthase component I [Deltaproteobacteria bacterium]
MTKIEPTFEAFSQLARRATVIPIVKEVLADSITPVVASLTFGGSSGSYLLESVEGGEKWARYSFVGFEPDLLVRGVDDQYEEITAKGVKTRTGVNPWEALRETLSDYRPPERPGLPRFWGGAVGYVSYDAVRRFEPTIGDKNPPVPNSYDFAFSIGGTVLIFDNLRQTIRIVVACQLSSDRDLEQAYRDACARIERAQEKLFNPETPKQLAPPDASLTLALPRSSFDRGAFCEAVERAKEYIRAGDIFQVVLSQRFRLAGDGIDSFDVYRVMRVINPSPYMYFLRFPKLTIAGASPEVLVRLEDGIAEVRPIAGTRRRGRDAEEDQRLEVEMLADPKERAEHVMLVDLGRNDLGRISEPGTVRVTEEMVVERYSHVMHIVSNVKGKCASGRDAIDVLRATFPAGTLSGAPKVRAMQIIEEMEPERRGVYGGAVGWIGFNGNMDTAIAIRTVVETGGEFFMQAGAGIVEASQPNAEYDETVNKARAALVALAAARGDQAGER